MLAGRISKERSIVENAASSRIYSVVYFLADLCLIKRSPPVVRSCSVFRSDDHDLIERVAVDIIHRNGAMPRDAGLIHKRETDDVFGDKVVRNLHASKVAGHDSGFVARDRTSAN